MTVSGIALLSGVLGIVLVTKAIHGYIRKTNKLTGLVVKNEQLMLLMAQWMENKRKNKRIESFFEKNGFETIAIYGMSYLGECLYEELKGSESVRVDYAIDKNPVNTTDLRICNPDGDLDEVDAIVVTAVYYFDEIADVLWEKVDCPIVSLEDVIRSI